MKQRFIALDGLRGVAAIAVVAYHAGVNLDLRGVLMVKANPAVDLFFCLSGFVLAYAHDQKIRERRLTAWRFIRMRILRFLPIVAVGSILGGVSLLLEPAHYAWIYQHTDHIDQFTLVTFLLSLVLVPIPIEAHLVWINSVYWSLATELGVNAVYAGLGPRATNTVVGAIWAVSAAALAVTFATMQTVQLIPDSYPGILGMLLRGFTSFFAGVLVYRIRLAGFRAPGIRAEWLIVLFAVPLLFPYSAAWFKTPLDGFFIIVAFPFIVWMGAEAFTPHEAAFKRIGEASFALYAIHAPLIYLTVDAFHEQSTLFKLLYVALFTTLALGLSILLASNYEAPARRALRFRSQVST